MSSKVSREIPWGCEQGCTLAADCGAEDGKETLILFLDVPHDPPSLLLPLRASSFGFPCALLLCCEADGESEQGEL